MAAIFRILGLTISFWLAFIVITAGDFLAVFLLPLQLLNFLNRIYDLWDFLVLPLLGGLLFLAGFLITAELSRAQHMNSVLETNSEAVRCFTSRSFLHSLFLQSNDVIFVPHAAILSGRNEILLWSYHTLSFHPVPETVSRNLDLGACYPLPAE